jgi:hypothetical protein
MIYQISEKNQILVALFAIVVLCAGKLFKDYLFRSGYVEGMTSNNFILSMVADVPMSRPSSGNKPFNIYFRIKMPQDATVIAVDLPADKSNDVILSATGSEYTLKTVNVSNGATTAVALEASNPEYTGSSGRKISFTAASPINMNTIIQIGVKGTLSPKDGSNEAFGPFKVIIGTDPTAVFNEKSITITPSGGVGGNTPTSSAVEIQNAINSIRTRLNAMTNVNDPGRAELLQAQSALVTVLAYTYGTVKEAGQVFDSEALYEAQKTAIEFIKTEKKRAASNATLLKEDNSNKRRMAQVNTYYTRNYEANTEVMKNIIFVSVALIIMAILRNKELIPTSISTLGVIFILTLGGIVIGGQVFDIIRRNDHDFDKYDWNFNEEDLNKKQLLDQNADTANLSDMGMGMAPCYGPGCCDVGTSWDNTAKKCIPGAGGRVSGTAAWSSGSLTITLTVPSGLAILAGATPADTVTITLPSGLFSGTPAVSGSAYSGTPSVSAPFVLTKTTTVIAAASPPASTTITITGMTISPNAYTLSKQLTVKTTKDINPVGIAITGISS